MTRPFKLGLVLAAMTTAIDQANKLWMIFIYQIERRSPVTIAPFFDLVMAWNKGISYGLLTQNSSWGRWLLIGFAAFAIVLLALWMARAQTLSSGAALGLIIGGAVGNAIDRLAYGAVADFYQFHLGSFSWYVFNLADVAIVAGVFILLYEAFRKPSRAPR